MVYGAEAVMPTDLEHDSPHIVNYAMEENDTNRQNSHDLLDESRDLARSHSAIYQQGLRRYHSLRTRSRTFQVGDLVLRLEQDRRGMHKLSPPWTGTYVVNRILGKDAYYLTNRCPSASGKKRDVNRPWNINLPRRFYA